MDADTGFGFHAVESGLDRMHRWAVLLALASPLAGLAILAASVLNPG
ncbi:MAG TPA: hypothetical protein VHL98_15865 [Microvirga sp.]|jgi:hypothetical protein|nr:hypothetical protein [Microvirga sp.]